MKKHFILIYSIFCLGILTSKAQYHVICNIPGAASYVYNNDELTLSSSGNVLYGNGGTCIFKVNTDGSGYGVISNPPAISVGALVLSGSKLYGMGEGNNYDINGYSIPGTIFSIDTNGTGYTTIFIFPNGSVANAFPDGMYPQNSLTISTNGNVLYGMTEGGDAAFNYNTFTGTGSVFSINTNGTGFKLLTGFYNNNPMGALTLSGNVLYGMTSIGGTLNNGTVFSIDTNGSGYQTLYNLNDTDGYEPQGNLTLVGSRLYGMTNYDATYSGNGGDIFSLNTDGTGFQVLHKQLGFEYSSLTLAGGKLYGTNPYGGSGLGNIFCINTDGSGYTDLFDFNGTNGKWPSTTLILSGNLLYGVAQGYAAGNGKVFSFNYVEAGINNLTTTKGSINIYPNPNNGIFTLTCHSEQSEESLPIIKVYNVLGEQVLTETLHSAQGDNTIDISNQPNGIYLYRVVSESGNLIGEGKVVLQK